MLQWASDIRIGKISLEQSAQVNEGTWKVGRPATRTEAVIEPVYGMGELFDTMFSNGMMPEWAFRDQHDWAR